MRQFLISNRLSTEQPSALQANVISSEIRMILGTGARLRYSSGGSDRLKTSWVYNPAAVAPPSRTSV